MASNINPQNIDGAYPVAGQDNDSQGFRDNFTNTRTNFAFAAAEITDLQNKAVLKAALDGTVLNNDMGGSILSNAQLQDMSETRVALGTVGVPQTINYAAGPYYTLTTSGSVAVAFTNFPPAGQLGRIRLQITVASTAHTLTLPAAVSLGTTGIQGYAANVITFGATGTYEFEFETNDGGSTITIFDLNRPLVGGFTNQLQLGSTLALTSSEDLADSAAASLAVSTSYIATGASGETATLAAGANGQIKIFAMTTDGGGNMVITVANAAWGGSGTITFGDVGDGCTLIYVNSKWVCVGNNGCTFA
jgi:hypothetical protein